MYSYQADVWCDDCGEAIKAELDETIDRKGDGVQTMKDTDNGDSDGYPQWHDDDASESDSPSHCAAGDECKNRIRCGEVRGTSTPFYAGAILGGLTKEGIEYVQERLRNDDERSELTLLWREHFEPKWPEECRIVRLSNSSDDPTQIMVEVNGPYAADWADEDRTIEGSSWETPSDMPGFAYATITWHPDLIEDLQLEGYELDLSEYADPDAHEVSTAMFAAEWFDGSYRDAEDWIEKMFPEPAEHALVCTCTLCHNTDSRQLRIEYGS